MLNAKVPVQFLISILISLPLWCTNKVTFSPHQLTGRGVPMGNLVTGGVPTRNFVIGNAPMRNFVIGDAPMRNCIIGGAPTRNYVIGDAPMRNWAIGDAPTEIHKIFLQRFLESRWRASPTKF